MRVNALADAVAFTGDIQALMGKPAAASYARATSLLNALVILDPKNRQWQHAALNIRVKEAALLLASRDTAAAARLLAEARSKLSALVTEEPSSRAFTVTLAMSWRIEAQLRLATQANDAREAAARALELSGTLIEGARADHKAIGEFAQSCVSAGRIALAQSQPDLARQHWNRCLTVLAPRLPASNDWRALDPAAQALLLLGKPEEARPLVERLGRLGYHSIDPLAASTFDANFPPISPTKNQ